MLGGSLMVAGCLMPAMQRIREERQLIRLLEQLSLALNRMGQTMELTAPDTSLLLKQAARESSGAVRCFFRSIRLEELEREDFSAQWQENTALLLPEGEEYRIFEAVGEFLGRCSAEEQCRSLQRSAQGLENCAQKRKEELRAQKKLWLTLSGCAGGLMALLLL